MDLKGEERLFRAAARGDKAAALRWDQLKPLRSPDRPIRYPRVSGGVLASPTDRGYAYFDEPQEFKIELERDEEDNVYLHVHSDHELIGRHDDELGQFHSYWHIDDSSVPVGSLRIGDGFFQTERGQALRGDAVMMRVRQFEEELIPLVLAWANDHAEEIRMYLASLTAEAVETHKRRVEEKRRELERAESLLADRIVSEIRFRAGPTPPWRIS